MSIFYLLCLLAIVATAIACDEGTYELTIIKNYGQYTSEETLAIFKGTYPNGVSVFSIKESSSVEGLMKTYTACTTDGAHYLSFTDSYGDAWGGTNKEAGVWVYRGDALLVDGSYPYVSGSRSNSLKVIPFDTTLLKSASSDWNYSDTVQTGNEWTTNSFATQGWSLGHTGTFVDFTATTRYYRSSFTVSQYESIEGLSITVSGFYGYRIYVNGELATTYNLPSEEITATTYGLTRHTYTSKINLSKYFIPTSGSTTIAIESHRTSGDVATDSFSVSASFIYNLPNDRSSSLFLSGVAACTPTSTSCVDVFSNDLAKNIVLTADAPYDIVYTLPNNNQENIGYYMLSSASTSGSYPSSWILYGSNDQITWVPVDSRVDIVYASTTKPLYFSSASNTGSYNSYKLHILSTTTTGSCRIGQFRGFRRNIAPPAAGLHYSSETVTGASGVDKISISVISSGYTNFSVSEPLPSGLSMDALGTISGISTNAVSSSIVVTGLNLLTNSNDTCTITFNIYACSLPSYVHVRTLKTSTSNYNYESYTIKSDDTNEVVFSAGPFTSSSSITTDLCLPTGLYVFELSTTSSSRTGWYAGSNIVVSVILDNTISYKHAVLTLPTGSSDYYEIYFDFPSYMAAASWTVSQTVPSADWYLSTYAGTEFSAYSVAQPVVSTSNIWFFRTTVTITDIFFRFGLQTTVYARAGIAFYVNGELLYRRYIPDGPITAATVATAGTTSPTVISIDTLSDSWTTGANTIAIALINVAGNVPTNIDAIFNVQFIGSYAAFLNRNWDATYGGSYSTNTNYLFDNNLNNEWSGNPPYKLPSTPYINFGTGHGLAILRYCITSGTSDYPSDPSDWGLYGAFSDGNYVLIHNVTNAYFADRHTERCFYIPGQNKAYQYYKFDFYENAVPIPTALYKYKLAEIQLGMYALKGLIVSSLRMIPNTAEGIIGTAFPSIRASNSLYGQYSITPALPEPLEIDTTTAAIRGIPKTILPSTQYTVTGINPLGRAVSTTLTLSVKECSYPNVLINVQIKGDYYGEQQGYQLRDINGQLVASATGVIDSQINSFPSCVPANLYYITLTDSGGNGWTSGYCIVTQNNDVIFRGSLGDKESSKTFPLSLGYVIEPTKSTWKYFDGASVAPASWNTVPFEEGTNWSSAVISAMPVPTGKTFYIRYEFTIDDITRYAAAEIRVKTKVGFIAYINGNEIYRRNMPEGNVSPSTDALELKNTAIDYAFSIDPRTQHFTNNLNVLAVEIHQVGASHDNTYDAQLSVYGEGSWRGYSLDVSVTGASEDVDYIIDNNIYTVFKAGPECVGTVLQFDYKNERTEFINAYSITTGGYCNARHPSGWILEGSNDKSTWTVLHSVSDAIVSQYNMVLNFTFYNQQSYKNYRMTITECDNVALDGSESDATCLFPDSSTSRGFQVADINLYSKFVTKSCSASNGYPDAAEGQNVVKGCPKYYTGIITNTCVNSQFGDDHRSCALLRPTRIVYSTRLISVKQKDTINLVPEVYGAEYTCIVEPALPTGFIFDPKTGSITGTAEVVVPQSEHQIYCSNSVGSTPKVSIYITVEENNMTSLIIIIVVIVVIVIIIILVLILCIINRSKPKMRNGHAQLDTKKKNVTGTRSSSVVKTDNTETKNIKI